MMSFDVRKYLVGLIERDRPEVQCGATLAEIPQAPPPSKWARRAAHLLSAIEDAEVRADCRDAFETTIDAHIGDGIDIAGRHALAMLRTVMRRRGVLTGLTPPVKGREES